ncbi:MAG: hypothetical protein BWY40_00953 [bacterium ADurb.Bin270]|nr:MAG: hypothetical protein BWY40_00953 [bacterium ADurb.Bin270]
MIRVLLCSSFPPTIMEKGRLERSTFSATPEIKVAPRRSACALISAIRAGPSTGLAKPGKFSTSVVIVS